MEANYFTILWWFLLYIDINQPWVYMCSPFWTPSHLLPHPIPQGHPNAPALSTLSHASNLDWRSISHMVIYMFQCDSLKSSHSYFLPHSPTVCSLHLCLFRCLAYKVIVTIFLNSISSVQFSHSVVSDSLWPRKLQHARPPCLSPTAGVHPNPCPLSQWCHPTILSSVIPFSSAFNWDYHRQIF